MTVRLEDRGDRLIVWNQAEKRGAITPEFYDAICAAIAQADAAQVRAVVLASGGDYFCAGGNLNVLIERSKLPEEVRRDKIEHLHETIRAIRASPVPVLCAVEGGAAGAGLSIALACDLIVAAQGAKFTAAYVKAGLVPDGGLTSALARALPRQLAMEMCLLARPITAERMASFGIVTEVTPAGSAFDVTLALADQIATGPREAQGVIRALVAGGFEVSETEQLDAERDKMARAQGGAEAAEGIAAFLEKRKAQFP